MSDMMQKIKGLEAAKDAIDKEIYSRVGDFVLQECRFKREDPLVLAARYPQYGHLIRKWCLETGIKFNLPQADRLEIAAIHKNNGYKVDCIKYLRDKYQWSLRLSKDIVDSL